ncbi:MAG: HAD-IB family hydrolase, partial [Mycolicibacterium sp.]
MSASGGSENGFDGSEQQLAGEASAQVAAESLVELGPVSPPPPPPPDLTAAAFFDVDNTLVPGSSRVPFARGRAARQGGNDSDLARGASAQAECRL